MTRKFDHATRRFLKTAAVTALAGAVTPLFAQKDADEGTRYRALQSPQPTDAPGRIEVLEFFWYGCPHCNAFEPALKEWVSKLPGDVVFRKVHVGLGPSWVAHQQLFYALDAMGKTAELNPKIFAAIHVEHNPLDKPDRMAEFLGRFGIDRKQFLDTYESFAVRTRMRKAGTLAEAYQLDGVPALGVNGRWFTSPTLAGGNAEVLKVLDRLIERERKTRR